MKFLLYSDVHLNYCLSHNHPFIYSYYHNHVRAIHKEVGAKLTRLMLNNLMLHRCLDALSIINIKAKELNCDLIVNLGDTFGSTRFYQSYDESRPDLPSYKHDRLDKELDRRFKEIHDISRMYIPLYKHIKLFKEVFNGHIVISGNNDPFFLPDKLHNIFTYIDKPTVMFDKYLFVPMLWEEGCGGGAASRAARRENQNFQIANPENIEIVFTHEAADYQRLELSRSVKEKKLFHGHSHKRHIPKRANSKNVCVGGFFEYYTGFITYDDAANELKTYNVQGEEVNHADDIERYNVELERSKELIEDEKIKALNSYSKAEREKLVYNAKDALKKSLRNNIIEHIKQQNCTDTFTKEQFDALLERQIVLLHYIREYEWCRLQSKQGFFAKLFKK